MVLMLSTSGIKDSGLDLFDCFKGVESGSGSEETAGRALERVALSGTIVGPAERAS